MKQRLLLSMLLTMLLSMLPFGKAAAQEAYAHYDNNGTLTFYYDGKRNQCTGITYDLNSGYDYPAWYDDGTAQLVTHVVFDPSFANARPTTGCSWFNGMRELESITGIKEYLNTSEMTNMARMFLDCVSLTELNLSMFDTHNVTTMTDMFSHCLNLWTLDLRSFNTKQVNNFVRMFSYCCRLESVDLSSFDTRNVTSMSSMFNFCSALTDVDLSSFNTANVKDVSFMFEECTDLVKIYVSDTWDMSALTLAESGQHKNSSSMFRNCTSILGALGTVYSAANTDDAYARYDAPDAPGYLSWKPYAVYDEANYSLTFYNDRNRSQHSDPVFDIDNGTSIPRWTSYVTVKYDIKRVKFDSSFQYVRPNSTYGWFYNKPNLTEFKGLEYLNTSNVKRMDLMFYGCKALESIDLSHFDTGKVKSMYTMFYDCNELKSLDLSHFDTSNVQYMDYMFGECNRLANLNLSSFNTANVRGMQGMFFSCWALQSLDLSHFDTKKVQDMGKMFFSSNLTTLDVSSFDTQNVEYMEAMFFYCEKLESLDLSSFDTRNVRSMEEMFSYCEKLESLDLSSFDTQNVTNMYAMFYGCKSLKALNLSGFDTRNVTNMEGMFYVCRNLATITVGNKWSTAGVTSSDYMFYDCTNLVGGMGTVYDEDHLDAEYAHVDGGTANPGYLTQAALRAYTVIADSTLTFYYDYNFGTRKGKTYDLNEGENAPSWFVDNNCLNVTQVVFDSSFADARPTTCNAWFASMRSLHTITGMKEYLNTSEVTSMRSMFYDCWQLKNLDLTGFDTRKVKSMRTMFYKCILLPKIDLKSFDTQNVTNMSYMFASCYAMRKIFVSNKWTTASLTESDYMFHLCEKLVGEKGTKYDENHIDAAYAHVDGGTANPGYLTLAAIGAYVELANDTLTFYYDYNLGTRKGVTYRLNEGETAPAWHFDPETGEEVILYYDPNTGEETSLVRAITAVVFDPSFAEARPTSCYGWFSGMENLQSITGMKEYLNTSQVEHMAFLFANCSSLTSLDVSAFDTRNVKTMYAMFRNCSSLQTLDVTNFNTSCVTNMFCLFEGCSHLTSIDVSHFDTHNVTTMESMFENCWSLETLDLSAFDTHSVTSTMRMFIECQALTTIIVGDKWTMENVDMENYGSDYMFYDCYKLVGGAGTTYAEWRVDGRYAHIDGGDNDPGYFTAAFLKGDVNNDGQVGIGDIVAITNVMAGIETDAGIVSRADVNADTQVGIGDIVAVTNIMAGI